MTRGRWRAGPSRTLEVARGSAIPCLAWGVPITVAVALCAALVQAQPATKVHRIGFLMSNFPAALADRLDAFGQGLRDLGYAEGKNIVVEYRSAEEKIERLPALAAELVRLKVEVIVTAGPTVTRAAKEATSTIPIVMAFDSDPIGNGFAASLARPGGNITGLSALYPEISGKQLEILKEIIPRLSRVTAVGTLNQPGTAQALKALESAAQMSKVQLRYVDVVDAKQIETAFHEVRKGRAEGVIALSSSVFVAYRREFADLAVKGRVPVMYSTSEHVDHGGLASYGVNRADLYWRAATYVDKILKGARPAELPVEQPTRFELIINRKAAGQIGLTVPASVLQRADRLID